MTAEPFTLLEVILREIEAALACDKQLGFQIRKSRKRVAGTAGSLIADSGHHILLPPVKPYRGLSG
jgi:hypothetical protein